MSLLKESVYPIHLEADKCLLYALTRRDKTINPCANLHCATQINHPNLNDYEQAYQFTCGTDRFSGMFHIVAAVDTRNGLWSRILKAAVCWSSFFDRDRGPDWEIQDGVSLWSNNVLFELKALPSGVEWESYPLLPKPEHVMAMASMKDDPDAFLLLLDEVRCQVSVGREEEAPENVEVKVLESCPESERSRIVYWSIGDVKMQSRVQTSVKGKDTAIAWTQLLLPDENQPLSHVTLFTGGQAIPVSYLPFKDSFKFFEMSLKESFSELFK